MKNPPTINAIVTLVDPDLGIALSVAGTTTLGEAEGVALAEAVGDGNRLGDGEGDGIVNGF